jgi:putative copper resistance protein D
VTAALAVARFLQFASLMILFGAAIFVAALAPASVDLAPRLRRWAPWLAGVAAASAAAWFYLVALAMAGDGLDLDAMRDVALGTAFGKVWIAHGVLLVALLSAAWTPPLRVAVLAGLALASLALTGHAAMQEGLLGALHRANHALHLLATAGWLGGLAPFLVCLSLYAAAPARRDALAAMRRYSRAGHFAVPLVLLTGALDAALTTGLPPWRAMTDYRLGLTIKTTIFAGMTALALFNRYVLAPRAGFDRGAARGLAAGAVGEIVLGLAALADVSILALFDPS